MTGCKNTVADQKPAAVRTVSAEILSPEMRSPEFLGGKSFQVERTLSCEEVLRPPSPPPPLPDEPPPPVVPKREVGSQCSVSL